MLNAGGAWTWNFDLIDSEFGTIRSDMLNLAIAAQEQREEKLGDFDGDGDGDVDIDDLDQYEQEKGTQPIAFGTVFASRELFPRWSG